MKFLNKNAAFNAAMFALVIMFAAVAFDKPNTVSTELTTFVDESGNVVTKDENGNVVSGEEAFAASNLQRIYALDTISAATTTYITPGYNLSSPYQYSYYFRMRKIGVTPNVKIRLEQRNCSNSSIWSGIDSVSMSGADSTKYHFRLQGTNVYGAAHRIAFVKTGTGQVARNVEVNIKGTN